MKKALLLVNLGTLTDNHLTLVFKYLRQFLMDGRVTNINPILRFLLSKFYHLPN